MITHGTEENFNDLIHKDIVLVDFFATWCGPCKMLSSVLEELANDRADINIVKIDVDKCDTLAKNYGIMSVPTLILFKNGSLISKKSGYMPKEQISSWIEENR